jgi:magnesium-transporting ATPase (P-type)
MSSPKAIVIRHGLQQQVDAEQIVPGDIIVLENGCSIPADARLIESIDLLVDESSLTGESLPVEKNRDAVVDEDAQVGDRLNMVFSGCYVINGHAKAVVTATGMHTEMGIVAGWLNQTTKLKTRMQARMEEFGKKIALIAIVAGVFLGLLLYFQGEAITEILINAMSLAVAVIPEALPIVTIATFAFGVKTMARKMAVVRTVPAVEVLGGATVICSDKTGTLTMNKMAIQRIWAIDGDVHDASSSLDRKEMHLLEMAGLNCTASIGVDNGRYFETGDPTELSIVRFLRDKGIDRTSLLNIFPVIHMIPFDSKRKRMTTLHEMEDGSFMVITKGAVDFIPYERNAGLDTKINNVLAEYGDAALRTIAVATKRLQEMPAELTADELETRRAPKARNRCR